MNEFIEQTGPLFWVLAVFSLYGLAVVSERILYFHRIRINLGDFLKGLSLLIRKGDLAEACHEASMMPGPVARVIESVLSRPHLPMMELRAVADEAAQLEVYKVEKNIRGLLVVATLSPLAGVLGTILGLTQFYSQSGVFEGKVPSLVMSEAVFQALLTSALGLIVAIPAYLFYVYLAARARAVVHELHRAGLEVVYLISDARMASSPQKTPQQEKRIEPQNKSTPEEKNNDLHV